MPENTPRRGGKDRFDVSVDEGTFDGYEAFGVYNDGKEDGSRKGRSPEYEIFIVMSGQEV